jgi:hypothetical protein
VGQQDLVVVERAARIVDGDLDAVLGILTQRGIGAGQDAPVGDVDRIIRANRDAAQRVGTPSAGAG